MLGEAKIARESGLGRENLHDAFSAEGNPELSTVIKVIKVIRSPGIRPYP